MATALSTVTQGEQILEEKKEAILRVLPRDVDPERFYHIAISLANSVSSCDPYSIVKAIYGIAKLGLNPDPALQLVCIIPRNDKHSGKKLATVQIEYRGYQQLARNSGMISAIHAEVIYDNEPHEIALGTQRYIKHTPWYVLPDVDGPGKLKLAYCTWTDVVSNERLFHVINERRIKRAKAASQTGKIWDSDDEPAMWKKTVIIDAARFWPLSTEMAEAIRLERGEELSPESNEKSLLADYKTDSLTVS